MNRRKLITTLTLITCMAGVYSSSRADQQQENQDLRLFGSLTPRQYYTSGTGNMNTTVQGEIGIAAKEWNIDVYVEPSITNNTAKWNQWGWGIEGTLLAGDNNIHVFYEPFDVTLIGKTTATFGLDYTRNLGAIGVGITLENCVNKKLFIPFVTGNVWGISLEQGLGYSSFNDKELISRTEINKDITATFGINLKNDYYFKDKSDALRAGVYFKF